MVRTNVEAVLQAAADKVRTDPKAVSDLLAPILNGAEVRPSVLSKALLTKARADLQLGDYQSGEEAARKAEVVARSSGLRIEEGLALNEVGIFRFLHNDHASALNYYAAAEDLFKRHSARQELAKVYVNVGNVHQLNGDHFYALEAYEKAARLAEECNDVLTLAKVHGNLGSLYQYVLYDETAALEHEAQAESIYRSINDTLGMAKTLTHRGNLHFQKGQFEQAAEAYRESIELRGKVNEPTELALSYYGLVAALASQGRIDEAHREYEAALTALSSQQNYDIIQITLDVGKARLLHHSGRSHEAVVVLNSVQDRVVRWSGEKDLEIEELRAEYFLYAGEPATAYAIMRETLSSTKNRFTQKTHTQVSLLKRHVDQIRIDQAFEIDHMRGVERSRAMQQIDSMRKEQEEYITYLAHELKSPIDSIRSIAEVLSRDSQAPETDRKELYGELKAVSNRMMNLVRTTLDTASGQHISHHTVVNAAPIVNHLTKVAQAYAEEKGIVLHIEMSGDQFPVMATEQLIVTIVENLLSNALKFSKQNSSIHIDVRKHIGNDAVARLLISVKDEGPGILEQDKERLFRPFQRLSAQPTGTEGSHGLGLHLVKRAVDVLEGRIWVESGMDNGATFFVELPLASPLGS